MPLCCGDLAYIKLHFEHIERQLEAKVFQALNVYFLRLKTLTTRNRPKYVHGVIIPIKPLHVMLWDDVGLYETKYFLSIVYCLCAHFLTIS